MNRSMMKEILLCRIYGWGRRFSPVGSCRSIRLCMVLFFSLLLSGCGVLMSPQKEAVGSGYTVVDAKGNSVHIAQKPQRILTGSLTYDTIVLGLVPPDRLAAVNHLGNSPLSSSIAELTPQIPLKILSSTGAPLETVMKARPDIIFMPSWIGADYLESLRQLGYPIVICQGPNNIEETKDAIRLIARAIDEVAAGERIIAEMERQLAEIDQVLAARTDRRPVGMLISSMQRWGGPGCMYDDLCTRARIENGIATAGLKNGEYLAKELVVKANPDFFLMSVVQEEDVYGVRKFQQEFIGDPALQSLPGLRRIHALPNRYIYAASQNLVYGIKAMANVAYGDIFDLSDEHLITGYDVK